MKKNLIPFILGCLFVILIAAQGNLTQVFQPKKPTVVEVKSFRTIIGLEGNIKEYIDKKVKEGFIVKSVSMMDDETWSKGIVVMEKY